MATAPPDLRTPWLLTTPLPALALGLFLMHGHGVPGAVLVLQACAAGAAVVLAVSALVARDALRTRPVVLAGVALALVAATLAFEGPEGVRRWLVLGPLRLHASAFASPLLLLGAGVWLHARRMGPAVGVLLALQALHLAQPDAGQAAALGLGGVALMVGAPGSVAVRTATAVALVLMGAAAGLRPDPLPAVGHVERIVGIAASRGTGVLLAAIVALVLPAVSLRTLARTGESSFIRAVCGALAMYLAGLALVPAFGNFPVPVLGFSPSMLVGVWLALGLAGGLLRSARLRAEDVPRAEAVLAAPGASSDVRNTLRPEAGGEVFAEGPDATAAVRMAPPGWSVEGRADMTEAEAVGAQPGSRVEAPLAGVQLLPPWAVAQEPAALEAQLQREVAPGHPLHGRAVRALARRAGSEDVLFHAPELPRPFVVVHRTGAALPEGPRVTPYASAAEWAERCMRPDHEERGTDA